MINDEINRAKEILSILDDDDPDRMELLETETDIFKLIEWAVRKDAEFDCMIGSITSLIETYSDRKKAISARKEKMRELLLSMMEAIREKTYRGAFGTVSLKATPQKVIITNENLLPDSCFVIKRTLDKNTVKELLQAGELSGASLSNGGTTISIRR